MGEGRGNRAKEQENGRLDPLMHVEQRSVVLSVLSGTCHYVVTNTTKVSTAVSSVTPDTALRWRATDLTRCQSSHVRHAFSLSSQHQRR